LQGEGVANFLELGPGGALTALAADCLTDGSGAGAGLVAALHGDQAEAQMLIAALASLHVHGVAIAWETLFGDWGGRPVELPTYAFQRQRYWLEPSGAVLESSSLGPRGSRHPPLEAGVSQRLV